MRYDGLEKLVIAGKIYNGKEHESYEKEIF